MDLNGKIAVVTGGARRVGRAIAEALAGEGAQVVIHYHQSQEEAEALAGTLGGWAVGADLTAVDGVVALVDQVAALPGALGLWVNSAARLERAPFLDSDDALWRRTLELGVMAPARACRAVAPRMLDGGLFVNILDVAAHQPWTGYAHHCVAKAALHMLTRCLAAELGPRLRACGVSPGVVLPPDDAPDAYARLTRRAPLQRAGSPRDVAEAVLYLARADYVTGAILAVDGGLMARSP